MGPSEKISDKFHIGSIDLDDIGLCNVEVCVSELLIPYFYIFNEDNTFRTNICIYSNSYMSYYENDKLDDNQSKQLNLWLSQANNKAVNGSTNWDIILKLWRLVNDTHEAVQIVDIQPDYSIIMEGN